MSSAGTPDALRRTKRLLFVGSGRSGTTVLSALLGELPEWTAVGELRAIFVKGQRCTCGELLGQCPFWRSTIARAEEQIGPIDRHRYSLVQRTVTLPRRVWRILREPEHPDIAYMARVHGALLAAAAEQSSASVVVDSSKSPAHVAPMIHQPDTYALHVVRDSRGTTYSWDQRRYASRFHRTMPTAIGRWAEWNLLAELVARSLPRDRRLRMRYEDFVARPRSSVVRIAGLLGDEVPDGFLQDGTQELGHGHMIAVNPGFRSGSFRARLDDAWRTEMSRRDRLLVTGATAPLLLRYGYRLQIGAPRSPRASPETGAGTGTVGT